MGESNEVRKKNKGGRKNIWSIYGTEVTAHQKKQSNFQEAANEGIHSNLLFRARDILKGRKGGKVEIDLKQKLKKWKEVYKKKLLNDRKYQTALRLRKKLTLPTKSKSVLAKKKYQKSIMRGKNGQIYKYEVEYYKHLIKKSELRIDRISDASEGSFNKEIALGLIRSPKSLRRNAIMLKFLEELIDGMKNGINKITAKEKMSKYKKDQLPPLTGKELIQWLRDIVQFLVSGLYIFFFKS